MNFCAATDTSRVLQAKHRECQEQGNTAHACMDACHPAKKRCTEHSALQLADIARDNEQI
jgi:hypothetical protein